jgi:molybdopterin converting factor small subunit
MMATVVVRYFAAAKAAAGQHEESLELTPGATVGQLLAEVGLRHGASMRQVLGRCSVLLDEVAVHAHNTPLRECSTVDVLPPFAGG